MKQLVRKSFLILGVAMSVWLCNGQIVPTSPGFLMATAEARFGRPVTPVSVAGVARRSTVRQAAYDDDDDVVVVTPVINDGIGGPASGVGVLPGAGAGRAGVGYSGGVGRNYGGPVNRVGVR